MDSRKNNNKGKPQNHSNVRNNKGLSKDRLKSLQEMFGPMGISNNFINQVAQAHNYDVSQTASYLLAYADRMSKVKSQPINSPTTKQNPKNVGNTSSTSNQTPKNVKQTSNSSASTPIVNKSKQNKNARKNQNSSSSSTNINKPKHSTKTRSSSGPGLPLPPANFHPMKSFSEMFASGQSTQFTERRSTGAIKKIPSKSPGELEFERIVNLINTGVKVVVLLRGLPGSGKTHLAHLIFDKTVKSCGETKPEYHIFSTDTYFEWLGGRKGYQFDPTRLTEAHEWNRKRFCEALNRGISPVIVDNTNTMAWEMHPYVIEGMKLGYVIEVLEPFTPWAFKNNELARRNIHNVPQAKITVMNERYEHARLNGARLIGVFNLQYEDNNKPPQLRLFPKTDEDSTTASDSSSEDSSSEENDDKSEDLFIKYRYLCNIFPKLKIHHLKEIIKNGSLDPLWDFLKSLNLQYESGDMKCLLDVETDQSEKQSDENTSKHRYSREELLNILPSDLRVKLQHILDGIKGQRSRRRRRTESNTTETSSRNDEEDNVEENDDSELIDWTSEWNIDENITKVDDDETNLISAYSLLDLDDQFINNLPVTEIQKISDNDKNQLVEIEDNNSSDKTFSLPTFKNFFNFLTPKPIVPSQQTSSITTLEELLQSPTVTNASTMTNMNTFIITNGSIKLNDPDCYILETHSRDISAGCPNVTVEKPPPKILKLDKSSMTHEDNFLEETRSQDDVNKNLIELVAMFPKIRKNFIRDIYDKCHGDFYWAVELLLDTPVDEDTKIEDSSSSEDEEIDESPEIEEEKCSVIEHDKVTFSNKKIHPDDVIRVKKQVEEQFVIDDSHYSEHCLKIRRFRHGELPPTGDDAVAKQRSISETSVNESDDETDSNETEDSMEDDECLEMTLGFEFVNRLDSVFGKENPSYPEGLQPVIQVPKAIAQQLHLLWLESYYQQVCAHEERWEQMLKEDEEFARKLQEQETELSASGSQPQVPSIQEILNMEIDLEIAKRGSETNESYEDLASRLTKQKLYEMFSGIPQETVNDILDNFNNKYAETVNYLIGIMGDSSSNGENHEGIGSMFNEENLSNQEKQLIEQAKLASLQIVDTEHRPMIVVRESAPSSSSRQQSPSQQTQNKYGDAEYYREIGQQELRLRNECLEKARNMYLRGLTSAALYYSELAQVHKNKYEQANQSAAIYFVNSHSQQHNNNNTLLDLHYLYVSEALQVLDLFIDNHISQLQNANKKCITLNLITGRGARSAGGRARVKPAVLRRLKQRHLKYHFINPGLLKFKLRHYDVMTNSLK